MPDNVKLEKKVVGYDGYLTVTAYQLQHERFAGGMSASLRREVIDRGETAAVLPYDPMRDEVVLIEQFRPGAWASPRVQGAATPSDAWLLEIIAGVVEPGEEPPDVARRETEEESGLPLADLEPVAGIYLTPGICTEFCHIYCGRCDTSKAGGLFGHPEEGEDIRATVHRVDELSALLASGRLQNAITVVAVQWLLLHRDALRTRWT